MKDWISLTDLSLCNKVLNTTRFVKNLQPVVLDVPDNKKVLVVAAHPDDDIFGVGGTIIELKKRNANIDVIYLIGKKNNGDMLPIKGDQLRVCEKLGVTSHFLDYPNGGIPFTDERLINAIRELIGLIRPDLLFIPFLLDDHDDHRAANHVLYNAIKDLDLTLEVWSYELSGCLIPNVVINITENIDRKKELLDMYISQESDRDLTHYCLSKNGANCRYIPSKRKELESLVCKECKGVKIDTDLFPNTQPEPYWTSERNWWSPKFFWSVNFFHGHSYGRFVPEKKMFVRYVRDR